MLNPVNETNKILDEDINNLFRSIFNDVDYNFGAGIQTDYIDNENNTVLERKANANEALTNWINSYSQQNKRTNSYGYSGNGKQYTNVDNNDNM